MYLLGIVEANAVGIALGIVAANYHVIAVDIVVEAIGIAERVVGASGVG